MQPRSGSLRGKQCNVGSIAQTIRAAVRGRGRQSPFMSSRAVELASLDRRSLSSLSLYESIVDFVLMSQHVQAQHAMRRLNLFSPSTMHDVEPLLDGTLDGLY
uniref:Uncharacterized protein n=1 Tax=Physcomitrium patens TaxID=3218 RepID=A0A2K1IWC8_PHYPA|nr:hypothetical protein PHYPA_025521 [Physcomitrium patens]